MFQLILIYYLTIRLEVAKSNLEAHQHRFLASPANNPTILPQKSSYMATGSVRKPRQLTKISA